MATYLVEGDEVEAGSLEEAAEERQFRLRSSMNKIGEAAYRLSEAYRQLALLNKSEGTL